MTGCGKAGFSNQSIDPRVNTGGRKQVFQNPMLDNFGLGGGFKPNKDAERGILPLQFDSKLPGNISVLQNPAETSSKLDLIRSNQEPGSAFDKQFAQQQSVLTGPSKSGEYSTPEKLELIEGSLPEGSPQHAEVATQRDIVEDQNPFGNPAGTLPNLTEQTEKLDLLRSNHEEGSAAEANLARQEGAVNNASVRLKS